jgi:branched-chain amino acid aminotransferase
LTAVVETLSPISQTWTYFNGEWHEGNVAIMGPRTHATWLGSTVFDGARWFEGVAPDLDYHCQRVNRSAAAMGLKPVVTPERWEALAREGCAKFPKDAAMYIRPMYWAEAGGAGGGVRHDPESTRWCLCIYEAPMPDPAAGPTITLSPYSKPTPYMAPIEAKAGCLYPNNGRALAEAHSRGFGNALMRDANGNVAELANANVFMVKDGVVKTPAANGVFLAGITRSRVLDLLRADGAQVLETRLTYEDFLGADEIFMVGNFSKVASVLGIEGRSLQPGPVAKRARALYWDFAHS